jgi:hypothetical protein
MYLPAALVHVHVLVRTVAWYLTAVGTSYSCRYIDLLVSLHVVL